MDALLIFFRSLDSRRSFSLLLKVIEGRFLLLLKVIEGRFLL
jgi:hypothetical protein